MTGQALPSQTSFHFRENSKPNPHISRSVHDQAMTALAQITSIVLLVILGSVTTLAQSTATGTVSGQVTDPTNAVIVGATVSLTDNGTGATRSTTTNDTGRYLFVNVNPGTYDLNVRRQGFTETRVQAQKVTVGTVSTINVAMKVGEATQSITVEASGVTLQTMNATVGTTIGFQSLQEVYNLFLLRSTPDCH